MRSLEEVMVVASLEGALLDKNGKMPRANAEVIRLFCSRGGRFSVASNRTPAYVCAALEGVPVTEPVICSGGAVIYDVNKREYAAQRLMNPGEAEKAMEAICTAIPGLGVILQRQDGTLCAVRTNEATHAYLRRENTGYLLCQLSDVQKLWVRVIFTGKPEQMERLEQYMERHRNVAELSFARATDDSCHLLGVDVSKGVALRELAQLCEVSQPDIYTIGGNQSDQYLMQMAGHAVAMPCAPVKVKLAADLVTRLEAREGGAGEFLYQLIKEYER